MDWVGSVGLLLVSVSWVGGIWLLRREAASRRARYRLEEGKEAEGALPSIAPDARPAVGSTRVWPSIAAGVVVTTGGLVLQWSTILATGIGAVAGVLVHLALTALAQRHALQLEEGLAEAIGLASSALRAGASPVDALERAASAARGPARGLLLDLSGRLRLGEEAEAVLASLAERVPLESFRLFALALSVQWRAGGSLERSLAVVSRAVRDRVEVQRRIHTQAAPTRGSVFAFVAATAGIAFLMWQHDPANLEHFLASSTGSTLVGVAIWLQALGILWMWRISQIRV